MAPGDDPEKFLKQPLIMAEPPNGTVSDEFVPGNVQEQVSEPKDILYDLEALPRISLPEFYAKTADGESLFDQGHGGLHALQRKRHPLPGDRVQEPRAVTDEKESRSIAGLYRKA